MVGRRLSQLFATCAKGLEPLLVEELASFGGEAIEARRAGVSFAGSLEVAYRACLWSRVASRVLLPLATFDAPDEKSLYEGVRTIRFSEHLSAKETLAVHGTAGGPTPPAITNTHYAALKTKDAIVDQLREETGDRPSIDVAHPDLRVMIHLEGTVATLSLDLSGESLHRRGWREAGVEAPLKETLGAALLLLAGWPARAKDRAPFYDPMCGSGTLPIEAALIAQDRAPGLGRARWGFDRWRGHDAAAWRRLTEEAEARLIRDPRRLPTIVGHDHDAQAVRSALASVERAELVGVVHIEKRAFADATPPSDRPGLLVVNPPYGERLGEADALAPLYEEIGDVLRRRFPGWTGCVFTGNFELAKRIGLKPARRHVLWNGAIECRLLEFPISTVAAVAAGPGWRRPSPEVEMFQNRIRKNWKHLSKWARREDVRCLRVYDADLPEYAVAIDLYEDAAQVQEYQAPSTVDPAKAEKRLRDVLAVLPETLGPMGIDAKQVTLKLRRQQRPETQYEKLSAGGAFREVREGGHRFLVNLTDYLDTGLFLDHRRLRSLVGELAHGRDFLNLFAYTATATVYAAKGGARSTTSVDMSNTYLGWAERNLALNDLRMKEHQLVRDDCLSWLPRQTARYGLIFLAPPTFSNSKRMEDSFDVQRDHVALLQTCARLLTTDGILLFSNHFRRFKMDTERLPDLAIENITRRTLPPDFAGNPRIHNAWRIRRA